MGSQRVRLAAAGITAAIAAVILAACGGSGAAHPGASLPASTPPASTPATFNAADVAFAAGMLRLHSQAQAVASLAPARTTDPQVRQFAAAERTHEADAQRLRALMGEWGQPTPAPYTPGAPPPAGMGPGMMSGHDWDEMMRERGSEFTDHWLDTMIANRAAQIALCRSELRSGTSPQARDLARTMLAQRQAELAQLRGMHHDHEHNGDHD